MSKPRKPPSKDEWKSIGPKIISELEESNLPAHKALAEALLIPIEKLNSKNTPKGKTKKPMLQLSKLSGDIPKHLWSLFKKGRAKVNYTQNSSMSTIQISHDLKSRLKGVAPEQSYEGIIESLLEAFNLNSLALTKNPKAKPHQIKVSNKTTATTPKSTLHKFPGYIGELINRVAQTESTNGERSEMDWERLRTFAESSNSKDMWDRIISAVKAKSVILDEYNKKPASFSTDTLQEESRAYKRSRNSDRDRKVTSELRIELDDDEDAEGAYGAYDNLDEDKD